MLEVRPNCEHCNKDLPNTSNDAMICSFECTYCSQCALVVFENVCPTCGGNFEKRPIRPKSGIIKYPASNTRKHKPKDLIEARKLIEKLKIKKPEER